MQRCNRPKQQLVKSTFSGNEGAIQQQKSKPLTYVRLSVSRDDILRYEQNSRQPLHKNNLCKQVVPNQAVCATYKARHD